MRIGVDIGGMSIKIGMVDKNYRILGRHVIETDAELLSAGEIISDIADTIQELLREYQYTLEDCEGVGVACPGTIDTKSGTVLYSNNLGWEHVELASLLEQQIHVPVAMANDADAAAYGELLAGAARGRKNVILLTLGTGVGGGIILDGQIFTGTLRGGCEPGHMMIVRGGKRCTCGSQGCLEMYASARALMQMAKEEAIRTPDTKMLVLAKNDSEKIDGRIIFDCEKQGDAAALRVVEKYEENLSTGIVSLVNIFRPQLVLLGGGVSAQGSYLTDALQKRVSQMCFGGAIGEIPEIITCELGNDAGLIGAACLNLKMC